jgi:phosphopentomutase
MAWLVLLGMVVFVALLLWAVISLVEYQIGSSRSGPDIKTATIKLHGFKTYATITDGNATMMMIGYSIMRQLQFAGYKYKTQKSSTYSLTDDEFELTADPEVIGLVKIYCEGNGYANMHLHEFITRTIAKPNVKTSWLSRLRK